MRPAPVGMPAIVAFQDLPGYPDEEIRRLLRLVSSELSRRRKITHMHREAAIAEINRLISENGIRVSEIGKTGMGGF
jgi:hypothetical protein